MPVSAAQLAGFAETHAWRIPFDTSPRHLAGPGDARHVTHGLAAAGWKRVSDPLSPEIVMRSPDTRYSLRLAPQASVSSWWQLTAHATDTELGWYAAFGELVPAELIGAVTDALLTPPPANHPDLFGAVEAAGWRRGPDNEQADSPDGICHFQRERLAGCPDDEQRWLVEACGPGYGVSRGPRLWQAAFDYRAPVHLVHAFVSAVADPAPLQRGMHDSAAHYAAVQEPSPLTPEQVVAAHTNRLDAIRARARAARRRQQHDATPATPRASVPPPRRR